MRILFTGLFAIKPSSRNSHRGKCYSKRNLPLKYCSIVIRYHAPTWVQNTSSTQLDFHETNYGYIGEPAAIYGNSFARRFLPPQITLLLNNTINPRLAHWMKLRVSPRLCFFRTEILMSPDTINGRRKKFKNFLSFASISDVEEFSVYTISNLNN